MRGWCRCPTEPQSTDRSESPSDERTIESLAFVIPMLGAVLRPSVRIRRQGQKRFARTSLSTTSAVLAVAITLDAWGRDALPSARRHCEPGARLLERDLAGSSAPFPLSDLMMALE